MDFYQDFPIFQFFFNFVPHIFPWLSPFFTIFSHGFFVFFHDFPVVHPQMGRLSGPGDCAGGGLPRRPGGRRLAAAPRRAGLVVAGGECRGGARRQGLGWAWRQGWEECGENDGSGGEKMLCCMLYVCIYIYICEKYSIYVYIYILYSFL